MKLNQPNTVDLEFDQDLDALDKALERMPEPPGPRPIRHVAELEQEAADRVPLAFPAARKNGNGHETGALHEPFFIKDEKLAHPDDRRTNGNGDHHRTVEGRRTVDRDGVRQTVEVIKTEQSKRLNPVHTEVRSLVRIKPIDTSEALSTPGAIIARGLTESELSDLDRAAAPELEWESRPAAASPRSFWMNFRTVGPIMLGDIFSLILAALAAGSCAWAITSALGIAPMNASFDERGVLAMLAMKGAIAPWAMPAMCFLTISAFWFAGLYSEIWLHPVVEFRSLTHVLTAVLVSSSLAAAAVWAPAMAIACFLAWPLSSALVPFMRTVMRHLCVRIRWWGYPTLLIGSGDTTLGLPRMLADVPRSGLRPALLTDPSGECTTSIIPVVNDFATLGSLAQALGIRHAVIAMPNLSAGRLNSMVDRYSALIPHILVLSDTATLPSLWGASRSGRLSGLEVRNRLLLVTLQSFKRVIDLTVALTALVMALPVIIPIAIGVKLTSRGKLFYGQKRIGQHGKHFKAWKFRTMYQNSDVLLREYLAKVASAQLEWERDHKLRNDPRVTPIGKILRKLSLDELPQLFNVLKGEMSTVGPRPIVDAEVERYGKVFQHYKSVKPGITGLWQVSGRSDVSYEDRVRLDQFYIRHWSPWLDVYILAKTAYVLLRRDGAY